MAYQNPYMNYLPGYQQQGLPSMQLPQYSPAQSNSINWVSGESGAKSWMVGRGETVLLMDSENPVFYLKSSDQSGMPLPLRIFDYSERPQGSVQGSNSALISSGDNFITRSEFDDLRAKYEELEKQIRKPAPARKKEVDANE